MFAAGSRGAAMQTARSLIALFALASGAAFAAPAGEVTHVSGTFLATRADGTARVLAPRSTVEEGELLTTADNTYARVKFSDGGEITLRPNSRLQIEAYRFDEKKPEGDSFIVSLIKGGLRSITGLLGKRRADSYNMRTPVATIGIRGTHYGALLCQADCGGLATAAAQVPQDGLHVDVAEGAISLTNAGGQTVLAQGAFGYVPNLQTVPIQVPPTEGIVVPIAASGAGPGAGALSAAAPGSPLAEDCIAQ